MNTDQRTDEELNRVIAEWCGWMFIPARDIYISGQLQAVPEEWESPNGDYHDNLPNYCRDLNACHEAEMRLFLQGEGEAGDPYVRRRYLHALDAITGDQWNTVSATARQRAEALVRVIESSKQL